MEPFCDLSLLRYSLHWYPCLYKSRTNPLLPIAHRPTNCPPRVYMQRYLSLTDDNTGRFLVEKSMPNRHFQKISTDFNVRYPNDCITGLALDPKWYLALVARLLYRPHLHQVQYLCLRYLYNVPRTRLTPLLRLEHCAIHVRPRVTVATGFGSYAAPIRRWPAKGSTWAAIPGCSRSRKSVHEAFRCLWHYNLAMSRCWLLNERGYWCGPVQIENHTACIEGFIWKRWNCLGTCKWNHSVTW